MLNNPVREKVGVCLPGAEIIKPSQLKALRFAFQALVNAEISFRVIPEIFLIDQWDELDYIVYSKKCLGVQGKRKLQGFCAAGGILVAVDELFNFPFEVPFEEFICQFS